MPSSRLDNPEPAAAAVPRPPASPRVVATLLVALAALLAAAVAVHEPFSVSQPGFLADVRAWSLTTPIADTFTPLAYPLLLAPAFHVAGVQGILAVQAALYVVTVAIAFLILTLLDLPPRIAGLATFLILLHPELLLSITKIWDVGLSTLLFLLLVLVCLGVQRFGATPALCITLGLVLGAALFCRPNFLLLAPAILYALWTARARALLLRTLAVALIATIAFAFAGVAAHGRPFLPRNGPYNFYAGDNSLSAQALIEDLNAEPSIAPALRAAHPGLVPADPAPDFYFSAALEPVYTGNAFSFALHHPVEQLRLIAIKLFTLLRPDTKVHRLGTAAGLVKAMLALPALLFLIALLAPGRPALTQIDWLLLAFAVLYVLPFLLTNADPRLRTPLDALLLLVTARLLFRRFTGIDEGAALG
jgi:hypothetical protein